MRQVRDVLRLKTAGVAVNEIARRVGGRVVDGPADIEAAHRLPVQWLVLPELLEQDHRQ